MIDLTNEKIELANSLFSKYEKILEVSSIKDKSKQMEFVIILDTGIQHINQNYSDLNRNWKTWCIVVLKKLMDIIKNENDIHYIIHDFITYTNSEYNNYLNSNIDSNISGYEKEASFINKYVQLLINKNTPNQNG